MDAAARQADRRARRLAQEDFDRPLLIEAGAGTGKTATLVARVLAWCLQTGWQRAHEGRREEASSPTNEAEERQRLAATVLRGVVAITFTEAAASEMAERILRGLILVRDDTPPIGFEPNAGVPPEELRERAKALLANADQLQIRTIHAFCGRLLAEHPFAAGIHPQFTVDADGSVVSEVVEELVEAAMAKAYDDPGDADWLFLAARGIGPRELADTVTELAVAAWPVGGFTDDPLCEPHLAGLLARLDEVVSPLLTLLEVRRLKNSKASNAIAILEALGQLRRRLRMAREELPEIAELKRWLTRCLPTALVEHLGKWARGEAANRTETELLSGILPRLSTLAEQLIHLHHHIEELDPALLSAARRALTPLLVDTRTVLRSRGVLSFADLLSGAHALLERQPAVLRRLRARIDQLLVDEFQDTDQLQCELIRRLALSGPASERPGLFVVGDPKQSIYGWRSADLAAYEAFATELEAAGGRRCLLVESFRSAPEILREVDRAIAPIMLRRPGLQPEFHPLLANERCRDLAFQQPITADEEPPEGLVWNVIEYWFSWLPDPADASRPAAGTANATAKLEARAVAWDLLRLRQRDAICWQDVAILLRSFTDLEIYLAALREARIPFSVSRDRQYYRRREIIDAAALVRAVLAPDDHLALLTWLRSAAVGVPDAALIPLWAGQLPRLMTELTRPDRSRLAAIRQLAHDVARQLPSDVPGIDRVRGWELNLGHAASCLAALRASFDEVPADVFVDRLRRLTLFEATEATRYLASHRLANLDRFFTDFLQALEATAGDRHQILRRLRLLVTQAHEAEEAPGALDAEDAVRVLTIHQAKGLEFPHVYLLQLHKEAGRRAASQLELGEVGGHREYRLFGAPTLGFDRLATHRRELAQAELVRTLYVAMTRAEKRLVLVGRPKVDSQLAPVERATSHIELLLYRHGEGPSRGELARGWQEGRRNFSYDETSWIMPALDEVAPSPWGVRDVEELPSPAHVREAGRRLRSERQQAAEHMRRSFRASASRPAGDPVDAPHLDGPAVGEPPAVELWAGIEDDEPGGDIATLAGRTLHRVLETFDLNAEREQEVARQRDLLIDYLQAMASPDEARQALFRTEEVFEKLVAGRFLTKLVSLATRIVARELPVLLPGDSVLPGDSDGAVGYISGVIDLVYRDPISDEWVIVDFKSGPPVDPDTAGVADPYLAQAEIYARALREALGLGAAPRYELWFIEHDLVEVVELT